jgi:hypothetical protein
MRVAPSPLATFSSFSLSSMGSWNDSDAPARVGLEGAGRSEEKLRVSAPSSSERQ